MSQTAREPHYPRVGNAVPTRITKLKCRLWEDGRPQYVIAGLIGVAAPRLSDYANAVRPIPPGRIMRICEVLDCSPQDILGFEDVG